MQSWQIKALELEASGLKHLDGFIHEHALYFLIGAIYLLLVLLVWVERGIATQRRKIHHSCPVSLFYSSAGTATTAPGHVRPISTAAPFGALQSR